MVAKPRAFCHYLNFSIHISLRSNINRKHLSWWRHQMETFSALLAICAGNLPATGEFPTQRPVTRSFDVYFYLLPNERLSKQWWGWWFETLSSPLRRHRNDGRNDHMVDFWEKLTSHQISIILTVELSFCQTTFSLFNKSFCISTQVTN